MTILNLSGLWALLLIPVLILIHRLRNKSVRKEMTTLFIWEQVMKDSTGRISLESLLKNRSLLLRILTLFLLVLALADPGVFITATAPENTILILDTSASMKTHTGSYAGGTRFDKARQIALEKVEKLTGSEKIMVIDAGLVPAIAVPFTADKRLLARAINRMEPRDVSGNMGKAVYLALSFLSLEDHHIIRLLTDGAGYDLGAVVRMNPKIKPLIVRGGEKNIGITRFEFRPLPGEPNEFEVLVELKNYSESSTAAPLEIASDNTPIARRSIGLASLQKKTLIFPFRGEKRGILTARIRATDDLESDNTAFGVFPSPEKTNVFLVSKGNFFLERLLTVDPGIRISSSPGIVESSWEDIAARNNIVILDNIRPPALARGNFLLINTLAPGLPLKRTGKIIRPQILGWDHNSPITRGLSLDSLVIQEAMAIGPTIEPVKGPGIFPGLFSILESERTPLIIAFSNKNMKAVVLGFDIRNSDLPLRVAFPVLMKNIFQWFHPVDSSYSFTHIKAGAPYQMDPGTGDSRVMVRRPSGEWEKLRGGSSGFTYTRTDEVGVYKVKTERFSRLFAVNLTDEAESDIRPPASGLSGEAAFGETGAKVPKRVKSVRALFMAAALAVFLAEALFWMGASDAV